MPFTFSHPAAVLPLARYKLRLSGLVIGSMIPDLVYFLGLMPLRDFTHSIPGLLLYCIPAGLAAVWLFQSYLRAPLAAILQEYGELINGSGRKLSLFPAGPLGILVLSIFIGAATHVLLDGFTHEDGWALQYFPFLGGTVLDLGFDRVSLTRVLHHSGSLLGGAYIFFWARRRLRFAERTGQTAAWAYRGNLNSLWLRIPLALSAILGYMFAWSQSGLVESYHELRIFMVQGLFAWGTFILCFVLLYCLYWHGKQSLISSSRFQVVKKSGNDLTGRAEIGNRKPETETWKPS